MEILLNYNTPEALLLKIKACKCIPLSVLTHRDISGWSCCHCKIQEDKCSYKRQQGPYNCQKDNTAETRIRWFLLQSEKYVYELDDTSVGFQTLASMKTKFTLNSLSMSLPLHLYLSLVISSIAYLYFLAYWLWCSTIKHWLWIQTNKIARCTKLCNN